MRIRLLAALLLAGCSDSAAVEAGGGLDGSEVDLGRDGGPAGDGGSDGGASDVDVADVSASDGGPSDVGPADADVGDAGPAPPMGPWRVYVAVGGQSRLAVLDVEVDGRMVERTELALDLPGSPGAVAYDGARRLYVGLGGGMSGFATVSIATSGALVLEGRTTGTPVPVYLAAVPGEDRLASAYFGADELRLHDVSGSPPHDQLSVLATDEEPHAIRPGPGGRFYVPHRTGGTTWWLSLVDDALVRDGAAGSEPGDGPRHIAFHPNGTFAYVVNEFTDSVGTYARSPDGSLTRLATETTLPAGVDGSRNTCADIHITPDGRTVFASNRGHDSIARLRVEADGTLTFLDTTPTEARPREFELFPDGRLLLALGQDSGFVQSYRVDADGALTSVERLEVGPSLRWGIAVPRP